MKLTASQSQKVQVLRGLAIIAVVFIHDTPMGLSQVFFRPFFNFAVGIFLFLSGLLSSAKQWNPQKRIIKVIIPYILWTLIYTVMHNGLSNPAGIPIEFVKSIFKGNAAAIMYYIFVYCEFTLIIPLIDKLAKSKYKYWGFVITPMEIVVMRLVPLIVGKDMSAYFSIIMSLSCLGWFTYFYLGYMLGNKYIKIHKVPHVYKMVWMISIILQVVEGYFYYLLGDQNCGTQLKLSAVFSGVVFTLIAYNYMNNGCDIRLKFLKLLGDNSFGIFFSHLAVMSVLRKIPVYIQYIPYPITAIISLTITTLCVVLGKKILGKYSIYFAL